MSIDTTILVANGVDVAGAITEEFLNRFSAAHHRLGHSIYKGSYKYTEFESNIEIKYKVNNPLTFDITPIPDNKFKALWESHLLSKGKSPSVNIEMTPPNLKLNNSAMSFAFVVYKGHSETVDFEVDFSWDLEARCAVLLLDASDGHKALRLEPLKVSFSQPKSEIMLEISTALRRIGSDRPSEKVIEKELKFDLIDPNDPVWCTKLEKLFLFIINQVLAIQLTNFIREWNLPRAVEIIQGVEFAPIHLSISDKTIVVGGQINPRVSNESPAACVVRAFMREFSDIYHKEFRAMSDDELKSWNPDTSTSMQFLNATRMKFSQRTEITEEHANGYDENLLVLSNDDLFDAIAKVYLKAYGEDQDGKGIDHIVRAEAGYWYKVDNGWGKVISGGIEVHANIELGGWVRVGLPNPDPKHWGEWIWTGVCTKLELKPDAGLRAFPIFDTNGIFIRAQLTSQRVEMRFCSSFPHWANDLLAWITGYLTEPLIAVVGLIISSLNIKVIDFPRYFPGTALEIQQGNWRFNRLARNSGPYLVFSADTKF